MRNLVSFLIATICLVGLALPAYAGKDRLVLMPVRGASLLIADMVSHSNGAPKATESDNSFEAYKKKQREDFEAFKRGAPSAQEIEQRKQAEAKADAARIEAENKRLQTLITAAIADGLQANYQVFAGEQVIKTVPSAAKKECDETTCIKEVAEAFQAPFIAIATVSKREYGYFLELTIIGMDEQKSVYAKTSPCRACNDNQVAIKFKELSTLPTPVANAAPIAAAPIALPIAAPVAPPAATPTKKGNGNTFRDCAECPEMIVIPKGSFEMGSKEGARKEMPAHVVTFAVPFAMGTTEVTQAQWKALMHRNPSYFKKCGDDCPVETVSWEDVQAYIEILNEKTGKHYRLPSEAEWEYACRAGDTHRYCGTADVYNTAWHTENNKVNGERTTHSVATKQANAFGLYDMNGNVSEWVQDGYHDDYVKAPNDGSIWGAEGSRYRMLRGGNFTSDLDQLRPYIRHESDINNRDWTIGFRLVRTLP